MREWILHVSASPRGSASHSRSVGNALVDALRQAAAVGVTERDLACQPLDLPDRRFVEACLTAPGERMPDQVEALRFSEHLIGEIEGARALVIDTPMYNYTLPASLKIWVDYVVRPGRTFRTGPAGKVGLLERRPVYLVVSCGGPVAGRGQVDFLTPYLRQVLTTIGLDSISILIMDCMRRGPDFVSKRRAAAVAWVATCVAGFADRQSDGTALRGHRDAGSERS